MIQILLTLGLTAGLLNQSDPGQTERFVDPLDDPAVLEAREPTIQVVPLQEGTVEAPAYDPEIYDKLKFQVPDAQEAADYLIGQIRELMGERRPSELPSAEERYFQTIYDYIQSIDRVEQVDLSLDQVVAQTLDNSFAIEVSSFEPAISATQVVEAEAAFDAVFFANANFLEANQPTAVALQATNFSNRTFDTGLTKLLPTGMSITSSYRIVRRQDEAFQFALINPSYRNQFSTTFRQPFLRGFGLDFNRSQINIARNDRTRSEWEFQRAVRDQLVAVERGYWTLAAARRSLVIDARIIAEFQRIYDHLWARRDFDASPVEITDAKARLDDRKARILRTINNVKDSEDQLKNLINDPDLNLADSIEVVPVEFPTADPVAIDRIAELQAALDNREELKEARLGVENAKILVGVARNQALPRFDVVFNYTYDALGSSNNDAWENLWDFDFHTYTVGIEFEWPIGNRGRRAALRRARLTHAQSESLLKQTIEGIILDVNLAIRELETTYELIGANLTSVESQESQVKAIEDRAERRDPNQLNRELDARTRLANARLELLDSLLRYNFAITELERAKGTLLEHNNVHIVDAEEERY